MRKHIHVLFKLYSLRSKILLNLVLFTVIPFLVVAAFIYSYICSGIEKEHRARNLELLNSGAELINAELFLYINRSRNLITNTKVVSGLGAYLEWDAEKAYDLQNSLAGQIGDLENSITREDFNTFIFYLDDENIPEGAFVKRLSSIGDKELGRKALDIHSSMLLWSSRVKMDAYGHKYVTFYRNMTKLINYSAILEVNISYDNTKRYIDGIKLYEGSILTHRDKYGGILYQRVIGVQPGENIPTADPEKFLVISKELANEAGVLTIALPKSLLEKEYYKVLVYMFFVLLAIIIFAVMASMVTSSRITRSLSHFITEIRNSEDLLLNTDMIEVRENDEVSILKEKFIRLLKKMNETYRDLLNARYQNNILEVELLQARINPHLLYNSLSVIKWSALRQKDTRTVEIVDAMTNYYRIALNRGNNIIEVATEINMICEYVRIVNYTHSYHYQLELNIDEKMKGCHTLKHLLQPIVENAILHGLNGKGEDGRVIINGYRKEEDLVFEILDNGYGMEQDTVDRLMSLSYTSSYGGYGIKNIIKRIHCCYGESYGLSISSKPGEGTQVTVRIRVMDKAAIEEIMAGHLGGA